MGIYIKGMQKPKKGEVIAFDGENAVYTDDDMQVHRFPLIEIEEWNSYSNGKIYAPKGTFQKIYDGERRNDEKQSKDN